MSAPIPPVVQSMTDDTVDALRRIFQIDEPGLADVLRNRFALVFEHGRSQGIDEAGAIAHGVLDSSRARILAIVRKTDS